MLRILHKTFFNKQMLDRNCIDSARMFFAFKDSIIMYNEGENIGIPIEDEWKNIIPPTPKKQVVLHSAYNKYILKALHKADDLGWFKSYGSWINLGMAMKKHGFELEDWQLFCVTLRDKKDAEYKWIGFTNEGANKLGSDYLMNICAKMS
jgi:hypothetical protein